MAKVFYGILIVLAAFHGYSHCQNPFHADAESAPVYHKREEAAGANISQKFKNQQYITQLYKILAKGKGILPFGAQFVRSFSGIGKKR